MINTYYNMLDTYFVIHLIKKQVLGDDPRTIQQINFTENLEDFFSLL